MCHLNFRQIFKKCPKTPPLFKKNCYHGYMARNDGGYTGLKILVASVLILILFIGTSAQEQIVIGGPGGGSGTGTTGATATTGSTSTASTGSTASSTTGEEGILHTKMTHMEEKRSAPAWFVQSSTGGMQSSTTRHVARVKLKNDASITTQSTESGGHTESYIMVTAIATPVGSEIGGESPTPPPFLSFAAINGDPCVQQLAPGTTLFGITSVTSWTTWVQRGSANTLTGGPLKLYVYVTHNWTEYDQSGQPIGGGVGSLQGWHTVNLMLDKHTMETISVDSRRVYGKANLDGELPGDPNADLGNNNFQPWIYKGGHFVGSLAYGSSKDQSGTARTQLRTTVTPNYTYYIASCVSLLSTGTRGTFSPGTIGLYRPSATDPNLNSGLQTTWANKWNLNPGQAQQAPGNFTNVPYYSVTPTTSTQFEYLNWQLPYRSQLWQTQNGGNGNPLGGSANWTHVGLCQNNEYALTWQYFGSVWNEAIQNQMFPQTDGRPRMWVLRNTVNGQ
jgi:hypothetical protein